VTRITGEARYHGDWVALGLTDGFSRFAVSVGPVFDRWCIDTAIGGEVSTQWRESREDAAKLAAERVEYLMARLENEDFNRRERFR
jgi:hypothetical protein